MSNMNRLAAKQANKAESAMFLSILSVSVCGGQGSSTGGLAAREMEGEAVKANSQQYVVSLKELPSLRYVVSISPLLT